LTSLGGLSALPVGNLANGLPVGNLASGLPLPGLTKREAITAPFGAGEDFINAYIPEFRSMYPVLQSIDPAFAEGLNEFITNPRIDVSNVEPSNMDNYTEDLKRFVIHTYVFFQVMDEATSEDTLQAIQQAMYQDIDLPVTSPLRKMRRGVRDSAAADFNTV
jgi:hypothetical protein